MIYYFNTFYWADLCPIFITTLIIKVEALNSLGRRQRDIRNLVIITGFKIKNQSDELAMTRSNGLIGRLTIAFFFTLRAGVGVLPKVKTYRLCIILACGALEMRRLRFFSALGLHLWRSPTIPMNFALSVLQY